MNWFVNSAPPIVDIHNMDKTTHSLSTSSKQSVFCFFYSAKFVIGRYPNPSSLERLYLSTPDTSLKNSRSKHKKRCFTSYQKICGKKHSNKKHFENSTGTEKAKRRRTIIERLLSLLFEKNIMFKKKLCLDQLLRILHSKTQSVIASDK